MLPVAKLDTTFLMEQTKLILEMLKKSLANPMAIVCDGNRVNQSLFKQFETIKPWRTCEDLFLLFDYVHILKNIRSNWITEKKTKKLKYEIDGETKVAKWSDLEQLYKLECKKKKTLKLSKLIEVAVYPNPVERQKVSTCLKSSMKKQLLH